MALSFEIALRGSPEAEPFLAVIKPTLGALGAGVFGLTLFSFARVSLGK
jgi:hypothetical protein